MIPQTPPRITRRGLLITPKDTPHKKKTGTKFDTPRHKFGLFTPESMRKDTKQSVIQPNFDLYDGSIENNSCEFGLLLPTPSVVGKGRKMKSKKRVENSRVSLDFFKLVNKELQFEEDVSSQSLNMQPPSLTFSSSSKEFLLKSQNIAKEVLQPSNPFNEFSIFNGDNKNSDNFAKSSIFNEDKHVSKDFDFSFNNDSGLNNGFESNNNSDNVLHTPKTNKATQRNIFDTPERSPNDNIFQTPSKKEFGGASKDIFGLSHNQNFTNNQHNSNENISNQHYSNNQNFSNFIPSTPRKQLITPSLISEWQYQSPKFEQVDYDSIKSKQVDLPNPFLDSYSDKSVSKYDSTIDFNTHIEKINHKTGERIYEKLSQQQQNIKPKKLDFSTV